MFQERGVKMDIRVNPVIQKVLQVFREQKDLQVKRECQGIKESLELKVFLEWLDPGYDNELHLPLIYDLKHCTVCFESCAFSHCGSLCLNAG